MAAQTKRWKGLKFNWGMQKGSQWLMLAVALVGLGIMVSRVQQVQKWWSEATGKNAHLVIPTQQDGGILNPIWNGVSQGLEGDESMLEPAVNKMRELNLRLVRVDHVLNNYGLVKKEAGLLVFNFEKIDKLVASIIKSGAIPVLALSYMPTDLSEDGTVTGKPKVWGEWEQVIAEVVRHYSGKEGMALEGVYYEVWNEPDLFGEWEIDRGNKNYLELYEHTARAARSVVNTERFYLGGPGTTGMYQNWIKSLVNAARKGRWKWDFVSWHRYSKSVGDFGDDAKRARNWLDKEGFQYVQTIISEWGVSAELDPDYDTQISAAHGVAVVRELAGSVNGAWAFELKDGLDPAGKSFWGRWGMLTNESGGLKEKPRFKAWKMMDRLVEGTSPESNSAVALPSPDRRGGNSEPAQRLLVLGEGSWVTGMGVKTGDGLKLLLSNYDQFNKHFEWVPIDVLGLNPGNYDWKVQRLNGREEGGLAEVPTGIWRTNIYMEANEVVLLELKKK